MLLYPIGKDLDDFIRLGWIIGLQMQAEVMLAAHIPVHHILHGNGGAFTRLEGHRTDDRAGGSAALLDFDVRRFAKLERLIAYIRDPDGIGDRDAQFYLAVVDGVLRDFQARRAFDLNGSFRLGIIV